MNQHSEHFEAWAEKAGYATQRTFSGYVSTLTQCAWLAWKASSIAMQEEIEALKSAPLFDALANKQEARIAALEKVAEAAAKIWNPQSWLPVINFDELGEALREAGYLKEEG